jgi:hypothetical protein
VFVFILKVALLWLVLTFFWGWALIALDFRALFEQPLFQIGCAIIFLLVVIWQLYRIGARAAMGKQE